MLLLFMALLTVNGIYATDENQNISNISENTTIISTNTSTSQTSLNQTSTVNSTANNLTEIKTENATVENVTSSSNGTNAAGSSTVADDTFNNVQALFVWSTSLSSINPIYLASVGITDIYVYVPRTGAEVIGSFVTKFAGSGIRVWAWIPCFVDKNGNWLIAGESTIDGIDAREWIKKVINNTVSAYDVEGVILDYCRYPGTAYKHPNEAEATSTITNFVASVRTLLDTKSAQKGSYIYLGVCVMPECSLNTYYYGQSYEQLSHYVDFLLPMIYKGNYGKDTNWIGTTTAYIVNHSTVPVVAAVQTYESDTNTTPLNGSELTSDVQSAASNNASGYALFRYGLISSYPEIYENFTIQEILSAAETVKNYIETNKTLPTTITIGTTTINMAQFLYLATQATTQLNNGKNTTTITTQEYTLPNTSNEQLNTGTLNQASYVDFATRIAQYIQENNQAPPYGYISLGQISYQSQIYLYSRILTTYKNNGTLPNTITVKQWTTNNIPIKEPTTTTLTIAQILTAATTVKNYIETNKTLPTTITIGTTTINMAQFLYLATQATTQLNNGKNTTTITTQEYTLPNTSNEQLNTELLFQADYLDLASRITDYIYSNQVAPSYAVANIGQISYQSQIYLYSRLLDYYKKNQALPSNIVVETWSTANIPTSGINVSFTIDQIADTSTAVKNNVELYKSMPSTVEVAGVWINVAQFLYLATQATVQINNKNFNATISVENYNLPSSSYESMSSGAISLAGYVDFASRIASYMISNKVAPYYGTVSLGNLGYQTQIYLFSQVLDYYNTYSKLPGSISVKPWITVVYNIPAEYYQYVVPTSNCQSDNAQIIALANSISAGGSTYYDKAVLIFNWVRNNIGYSFYYNTLYGAVGTLNSGTGNCVDTSHLLIALLRAENIPARYVHGYCCFSSGNWYGHVWAEVYVNGQWYTADATSSYNPFGAINNWNTGTATVYGRYASLPF
jgi:hypothetical protein